MTYDLLITQRTEAPNRSTTERAQPADLREARIGQVGTHFGKRLGRLRSMLPAAAARWRGWFGGTIMPRHAEPLAETKISILVFFFR